MDLNRQVLLGVDELDENGEILKLLTIRAEDCLPGLFNVLGQGQSGILAVRHHRTAVLVAGQLPALRHFVQIALFSIFIPELGAAPEIILERRV